MRKAPGSRGRRAQISSKGGVMAKVLCVLYDDPVEGFPPEVRPGGDPRIERYPDGQTTPTPEGIDFTPGSC